MTDGCSFPSSAGWLDPAIGVRKCRLRQDAGISQCSPTYSMRAYS
jgi:hypothetical protein